MPGNIYFFNPTCEMAVANGQASYMPSANLRKFEEDLECMTLWLANKEDFVLVRNEIPHTFIEKLNFFNPFIPEFINIDKPVVKRKIAELRPWGWSPNVYKAFEPFNTFLGDNWNNNPMCNWDENKRFLLSRHTGLKLAGTLMEVIEERHQEYLEINHLPLIIYSHSEIKTISEKMPLPVILKTPWSASGRGLFHIKQQSDADILKPRLKAALKQQGHLFAEPLLMKVQDISFHFYADKNGYRYLGHTYFKTDDTGHFEGCFLRKPNLKLLENFPVDEYIRCCAKVLQESLIRMELNQAYHGPVGIDALFFINNNYKLRLHPCIEVNLRYTMGLLNLMLANKLPVHHQSNAFWEIKQLKKEQWEYCVGQKPLVIENGKLIEGVLELSPPPKSEGFIAYLTIYKQA